MTERDIPGSAALQALVATALDKLAGSAAAAALDGAPPQVYESLPMVLACSDFLVRSLTSDPQLLAELLQQGDLTRTLAPQDFVRRVPAVLQPSGPARPAASQEELLRELRRWRRRE